MAKNTKQQEVVAQYMKRFPTAGQPRGMGKKTLARVIYKENPQLWTTLDSCYTSVRYAMGALGNNYRGEASKSGTLNQKPLGSPGDAVKLRFPEGLKHHETFEPYRVNGAKRVGLLFDIHVPYHDQEALTAAVEHGVKSGWDCIILVGDFMDFYSASRWETDPRKRNFAEELNIARSILETIRSSFPKKQIIWKLGNHEERWESYLIKKAPELLGVDEFKLEKLMHLSELNIRMMDYRAPIVLAHRLNVIHGHEFGKTMTNPVNPARGLFLKGISNSICGHYHQSSSHSAKTIEQKPISTWSSGCLCDMHPDYAPMNNWNHGFIEVQLDGEEDFVVRNYRIINGKIYT